MAETRRQGVKVREQQFYEAVGEELVREDWDVGRDGAEGGEG